MIGKRISVLCSLASTAVLLGSDCCPLPVAAKNIPRGNSKAVEKVDCLILDQKGTYNGDQKIWVSPNAVKAYAGKNHVYVLSKAPDWKVYVFNEKRKVVFQSSLQKWQGGNIQGLAQYFGRVWDCYGWAKTATQQDYMGLKASKYMQGNLKKGQPKPEHFTIGGEYLTYEDFKQEPKVVDFLRKLHTVPSLGSIPLFLKSRHSKTDPPRIDLETVRVRREKVETDLFSAPTGFKSVKLENDVYSDANMQGLMEDMNN